MFKNQKWVEMLSVQGCQEQVTIPLPQVQPARLWCVFLLPGKKIFLNVMFMHLWNMYFPIYNSYRIVFQYNVNNYHIVKSRTRRNVNPTAVLFYIDKTLVLRNKVEMEFFHATADRASGWKALESFLKSSMWPKVLCWLYNKSNWTGWERPSLYYK